jgi:hypothetical protein
MPPIFACRPATFEDGGVEVTYRGESCARRNSWGVVPYQRLNAQIETWNMPNTLTRQLRT